MLVNRAGINTDIQLGGYNDSSRTSVKIQKVKTTKLPEMIFKLRVIFYI